MMRETTRYVALLLAFILGFGCFAGAAYVALNTVTINELRENNVNIDTEKYIGDNPVVSLEDMTIMGAINEYKELSKLGDELNLNVLIERYDLILPDTLDRALTDEARQIPLTQLLSSDGIEIIVSALYIGDIEGYQCLNADGERGDPTDPDSIWFNPTTGENVEYIRNQASRE